MLSQAEIEYQAKQFLRSRDSDFRTWSYSKDFSLKDRTQILEAAKLLLKQSQEVKPENLARGLPVAATPGR